MNDRALKVLEQYELKIISTRRGRGSYICETDQGWKMLCDYGASEMRLMFQNRVLAQLKEAGYQNVDTVLENREGKLICTDRDENRYILKDWFVGRECSSYSERDIISAVENLARIHQAMVLPEPEKEYRAASVQEIFGSKNRELKKVRSFIRKRTPKSPFEQLFLSSFPAYWEQASHAEELAGNFDAEEAKPENGRVCHGDYNYHNVLFLEHGMGTTNFNHCRFDYQVRDLYQFIRKILEKHEWDLRLGRRMIEEYEKTRTLPATERRLLYLYMAYPEKYWKLANHYYGSSKAYLPARYQKKLEMLNHQQTQRNNFLKILE